MVWWIVVAAYVASVALAIVTARIESKTKQIYDVNWSNVIVSLIPILNVVISILIFYDAATECGPPHWLIRLYGGKVR